MLYFSLFSHIILYHGLRYNWEVLPWIGKGWLGMQQPSSLVSVFLSDIPNKLSVSWISVVRYEQRHTDAGMEQSRKKAIKGLLYPFAFSILQVHLCSLTCSISVFIWLLLNLQEPGEREERDRRGTGAEPSGDFTDKVRGLEAKFTSISSHSSQTSRPKVCIFV